MQEGHGSCASIGDGNRPWNRGNSAILQEEAREVGTRHGPRASIGDGSNRPWNRGDSQIEIQIEFQIDLELLRGGDCRGGGGDANKNQR